MMLHLNDVENKVVAVEKAIVFEKQEVERGAVAWNKFELSASCVKPWLEKAEVELSMGTPKPIVLEDAIAQLQQAKVMNDVVSKPKQ